MRYAINETCRTGLLEHGTDPNGCCATMRQDALVAGCDGVVTGGSTCTFLACHKGCRRFCHLGLVCDSASFGSLSTRLPVHVREQWQDPGR